MKFKILLLIITLFGIFITIVFLSDFFLDKKEVHVFNKYSVIEINGEYNLMHKENSGYSLVVPSVLSVYVNEGDIIAISNLDGSNFINTGYVSKYSTSRDKYFYDVTSGNVKEISRYEFLKLKEFYNLVWKLK